MIEEDIDDELFHALLISLPSTESLIPEIPDCDPIALDRAREIFLKSLGQDIDRIKDIEAKLHKEITLVLSSTEAITDREIAKRAKLTAILHILTLIGSDTRELCELFLESRTMTLQMA